MDHSEDRHKHIVEDTSDDIYKLGNHTIAVHSGVLRSNFNETSEAIFTTQAYTYDSAEAAEAVFASEAFQYQYSRFSNPSMRMFEQRLSAIEQAECARATASGMAAVAASLLCQLRAGDHVITSNALFISCFWILSELLPRYGIEVSMIDGTQLHNWEQAMKPNTRVCFLETPSNPCMDLIDISAVANLAHQHGACLIVDNAMASPVLQQPLRLGANVVIHSATKHIDGQGRLLGGAILGSEPWFQDHLQPYFRHTGATLSAFNAWVLHKSLETLNLRVRRQARTAEQIALFLAQHPAVESVIHPKAQGYPYTELANKQMNGASTVIAFKIKGGQQQAFEVINRLRLILISNNFGDSKSLIIHPATTTHRKLEADFRQQIGLSDNLLRLSVGLEDTEDLLTDLDQALSAQQR